MNVESELKSIINRLYDIQDVSGPDLSKKIYEIILQCREAIGYRKAELDRVQSSRKPIESALRVVHREDKTFTAKDGTEYHLTLKREEGKARRRGGWQDVAYTTVNCSEFPETEWFPYSEGKSASFSTSNETTKPNFWDVDNVATAMIRDYKGWSSGETDKTISEIMSSKKIRCSRGINNSKKPIKSFRDTSTEDTSNNYGFHWDGDNIYDKDGFHWYFGDYTKDNTGIEPYSSYIQAVKETTDSIRDSFTEDEIPDPEDYAYQLVDFAVETLPDPGKFIKEYEGF